MKAISIGAKYEIYDDSLKAYDRLPAKTYTVRFSKMSGFFLEARTDLVQHDLSCRNNFRLIKPVLIIQSPH